MSPLGCDVCSLEYLGRAADSRCSPCTWDRCRDLWQLVLLLQASWSVPGNPKSLPRGPATFPLPHPLLVPPPWPVPALLTSNSDVPVHKTLCRSRSWGQTPRCLLAPPTLLDFFSIDPRALSPPGARGLPASWSLEGGEMCSSSGRSSVNRTLPCCLGQSRWQVSLFSELHDPITQGICDPGSSSCSRCQAASPCPQQQHQSSPHFGGLRQSPLPCPGQGAAPTEPWGGGLVEAAPRFAWHRARRVGWGRLWLAVDFPDLIYPNLFIHAWGQKPGGKTQHRCDACPVPINSSSEPCL